MRLPQFSRVPCATDGLIVLVDEAQAVAAAYVRADERYTITGIPDGLYTMFTSEGENWDRNAFSSNIRHTHYAEPIEFTTTATEHT